MGPRHARVLGWAKSYTKKLDAATMVEYDKDAVGGLSIMWSFVQSVMPLEVRDHVDSCLADVGLPRLATRNIDEGFISIWIVWSYIEGLFGCHKLGLLLFLMASSTYSQASLRRASCSRYEHGVIEAADTLQTR